MEKIAAEIASLKQSQRRQRLVNGGLLLIVAVLLLSAQSARPPVPKSLVAQSFVVVDEAGIPRIALYVEKKTGDANITIFRPTSKPGLIISANGQRSSIDLSSESGGQLSAVATEDTSSGLKVSNKNGSILVAALDEMPPAIQIADKDAKPRATFGLTSSNDPRIQFWGSDGNARLGMLLVHDRPGLTFQGPENSTRAVLQVDDELAVSLLLYSAPGKPAMLLSVEAGGRTTFAK